MAPACHCRVEWTWCHSCRVLCTVLWLGARVTANFGGVDAVPLLGAIAGCHCSVVWWGRGGCGAIAWPLQGAIQVCYGWGRGDDQLWGSGTWCHCWLCHCRVPISVSYLPSILRATNFTQKPRKQQWILFRASCSRYTVLFIDKTFFFLNRNWIITYRHRPNYSLIPPPAQSPSIPRQPPKDPQPLSWSECKLQRQKHWDLAGNVALRKKPQGIKIPFPKFTNCWCLQAIGEQEGDEIRHTNLRAKSTQRANKVPLKSVMPPTRASKWDSLLRLFRCFFSISCLLISWNVEKGWKRMLSRSSMYCMYCKDWRMTWTSLRKDSRWGAISRKPYTWNLTGMSTLRRSGAFWAVRSGFELRGGCGLQRQSFHMDIDRVSWVLWDALNALWSKARWRDQQTGLCLAFWRAHCQCAHFSLSQARQFRNLQSNAVSSGSGVKQRGIDGLVSSFPQEAGQLNMINLQWSKYI